MADGKNLPSGFFSGIVSIVWCFVVVFVLLLLPARFTAPARYVYLELTGGVSGAVFNFLGDGAAAGGTLRDALLREEAERAAEQLIKELESENAALRENIARIEAGISEYHALERAEPELTTLNAEVIAYDPVPGRKSISIAAGKMHGLSGGELITVSGAVAGQVKFVTRRFSRVRLITDPDSRLAVRSKKTREIFVLKGTGASRCVLEMVDRDRTVSVGDQLLTVLDKLPNDVIIPAGLPVAEVTAVDADPKRPLFYKVEAEPAAPLERIEHVLILKNSE